jgi:protein-S-isoprenylcysteine O-methyltransferase Ste14
MTPVVEARPTPSIVQTGPYRLVRHPTSTAVIRIGVGPALLFLRVPAAELEGVLLTLAGYRAGLEESLLGSAHGFGAANREFVGGTAGSFPRLRRLRDLS